MAEVQPLRSYVSRDAAVRPAEPVELTVVVPTFNEAENVGPLIERLRTALAGVRWEAVFVDDDSRDGTVAAVIAAGRADPRVRLIRRVGRRGLSSAVIEGCLSSTAPYVAVIDADMQHDEALLPRMLREMRAGSCDVVVGSRYAPGGGVASWIESRMNMSRLATRLARVVLRTPISDPMSGFFMITGDALEGVVRRLSGQGFKILLDIVVSAPKPLRIRELPYQFRARQFGESKLDPLIAVEFVELLADKTIGRFVSVRFLKFGAVGALGLAVHMAALSLAFEALHAGFAVSQAAAAIVAMTFNFFLNNYFTYRDRRLKRLRDLAGGLASFYAVCGLGAVANVGVANYFFGSDYAWWLSAVAGVAVGAVWNYAATSAFTWRTRRL